MPHSFASVRVSFQTKVLSVVLLFLVLVPAITVWYVDRHVTEQAETEVEQTLATADAVFRNSYDIRRRNLETRFRDLVNEPRFRAVAQLGDGPTLSASLQELLEEADPEVEWLVFSTPQNTLLAGARRPGVAALEACAAAAAPLSRHSAAATIESAMLALDWRCYDVVSVPVVIHDRGIQLGTLSFGVRFGERAVQELTSLTRTELVLLAGERILVSSLTLPDLDPAIAQLAVSASPTRPRLAPLQIAREHFLAHTGSIDAAIGPEPMRYVLLSSYEARLVALARTRWALVGWSLGGIGLSALLVRLLITRIMQPLRALRDGAEAVGRGDFTRRVETKSRDECGELAASFNRMTRNIQQSHAQLQATVAELRSTLDQLVQREQRLRESEESLRLTIESARDHAILTLDEQGRVLRWNAAAERLFGYNATQAAGLAYASFFIAEDRAAGRPDAMLAAATGEGHHATEGWRVRRDGSRFWADVTVSSLPRADGGGIAGYVEIARDSTVRHKTEEALRQARAAAEAANRAKSEFLANMSHEIRTPINAVLGLTSLLLEQKLPATQQEIASTIRHSAEALLGVIDDLLDLTKLEAGNLQIHRQECDLRACMERVAESFAEACAKKSLALEVRIAADLPPIVSIDAVRVRQILSNLIGNAVKFTERGRIELLVAAAPDLGADHWRCTVADTGIGIPHERQRDLFQPFFQVDSSAARRYGGTGLGLALAQRLIELLGGTITCESAPGQGSRFTFTLRAPAANYDRRPPPRLPPSGRDEDDPAKPITRPGQTPPLAQRCPMRVLVVEDNPVNTKVLTLILGRLGYKADNAENGLQALHRMEQQPYDVVFMDLQMPDMDGLEATRRLRTRIPVTAPPYILAFTANASQEDRGACAASGMHDFESKPANMEKISRALERAYAWLNTRGSTTSGSS